MRGHAVIIPPAVLSFYILRCTGHGQGFLALQVSFITNHYYIRYKKIYLSQLVGAHYVALSTAECSFYTASDT